MVNQPSRTSIESVAALRARLQAPSHATALAHFDRIGEAIRDLAEPDRLAIIDALGLMLDLHADQAPRPDGEPYVTHTLDVADQVVVELGLRDRDVAIAALLHDAVEDQAEALAATGGGSGPNARAQALAALHERYSARVAELVDHLTNPSFDAVVDREGSGLTEAMRRERKNALYTQHVRELAEADAHAFAIKLCDFRCNALRLDRVEDHSKRSKLQAKYGPVLDLIIDVLGGIPAGHPLWANRDRLIDELRRVRAADYR